MSAKIQMASKFCGDDQPRESMVNILNRRTDYFPTICLERRVVTTKSRTLKREQNFQIQTPRLCLTVKPFVHMTFL
jgi:hypothetical protein